MSACRFCDRPLETLFADLGASPLANSYATEGPGAVEARLPLRVMVCDVCLLVQTSEAAPVEDIFGDDYAYHTSWSQTAVNAAESFAARLLHEERLGPASRLVEIGSNDACLLKHFRAGGVPVLGVDPAGGAARLAWERHGVTTETAFFGAATAERLAARDGLADVIIANNVLAHAPDVRSFVNGLCVLLKPDGVAILEFPHLLRLIEYRLVDTIYHEHVFYFSLFVTIEIFKRARLRVCHVEQIPAHGGSLRLFVVHERASSRPERPSVAALLRREEEAGLFDIATYRAFQATIETVRRDLLTFLTAARQERRTVAGYGAPAKATTLLNWCGVGPELLPFTVDRSPLKIGRWIPGVGVPILPVEEIFARRPDYVLILPWNLRAEIVEQLRDVRAWGGRFVTALPHLEVRP